METLKKIWIRKCFFGFEAGTNERLRKIKKPSNKIKFGDVITLNKNDQILVIEVIGFTKRRLDYKNAKTYYQIL